MTFVWKPSRLIAKNSKQKFLGVCQEFDSDDILLTFDSEVIMVKVQDDRVLQSWTCSKKRTQKLTNPAIYSSEDQEYVTVQNAKSLRTFGKNDLNHTETFTLNHKIHSLVLCDSFPVVVLEDASVFHLYHVLEDPKEISPDKPLGVHPDNILFSTGFMQDNGKLAVASICEAKNEYKILLSTLHPEERSAHHFYTSLKLDNHQLKSVTAFRSTNTPTVFTIWSDGTLRRLNLQVNDSGVNFQLAKVADLQVNKDVSMVSVSPDHVAVLCEGTRLVIIDTKYGSVLHEINLDTKASEIYVTGEYLFLDVGLEVQKLRYSAEPVTLASAVLKQPAILNDSMVHASWDEDLNQESLLDSEERKLVEVLLKTNQETNFDKIWTKFWKEKSEKFEKEFARSKTMKKILERFSIDDDKKHFWPKSTVEKVISTGLMDGRWCDGIFAQILKNEDWELLLKCLQNVNDIPENIIRNCLSSLCSSEELTLYSENIICDGENPSRLKECLDKILELSYSENIMTGELSAMSFQSVLNFTSYLTTKLLLYSLSKEADQVINWLSLIVDAHISEFIMLEDAWPVIHKLQEALDFQKSIYNDCVKIQKVLTRIQSKLHRFRNSTSKGRYYVEMMKI